MRRRDFIAGIGSVAGCSATAASGQQAIPVVGFLAGISVDVSATYAAAFRRGLGELGFVEGQNVTVEYHWLNGQYGDLSALMRGFIHRRVDVIATLASMPGALAAKAATTTIPIVFSAGQDPVKLGLVASLNRPGGNATGINFFNTEVVPKRLGLLYQLIPNAVRVAALINPTTGATAESTSREVQEAARTIGLQIQIFEASSSSEIDAAFASIARDHIDALFVAGDSFFFGRRVQLANLAARDRIPAAYFSRDVVTVGGLMSYGTDLGEMYRQAGIYTANILKGAKPAELPVMQLNKFEFVINLQTARLLGLQVSPKLLATADEVIE